MLGNGYTVMFSAIDLNDVQPQNVTDTFFEDPMLGLISIPFAPTH